MLIITRKRAQKINFPRLGVTVEVLRLRGNTVCLGIDAPKDVAILRGEISDTIEDVALDSLSREPTSSPDKFSHDLRNRLNTISLSLHLLENQRQSGLPIDARLLQCALSQMQDIEVSLRTMPSDEPRVATTSHTQRPPFVVLVDDAVDESQLLAAYLRQEGMTVTTIGDGARAVSLMRRIERKPDVILLDMTMPGLDGFATLKQLRRNKELDQTKVFAVTGLNVDQCQDESGELMVDRWFGKPVRPMQLAHQIYSECVIPA